MSGSFSFLLSGRHTDSTAQPNSDADADGDMWSERWKRLGARGMAPLRYPLSVSVSGSRSDFFFNGPIFNDPIFNGPRISSDQEDRCICLYFWRCRRSRDVSEDTWFSYSFFSLADIVASNPGTMELILERERTTERQRSEKPFSFLRGQAKRMAFQ